MKEQTHDEQLANLREQLQETNHHLAIANSWKHSIFLGTAKGVGYAIGATIVAAIIVAGLSWTIDSIEDVPVLNKLIPNNALEQVDALQ